MMVENENGAILKAIAAYPEGASLPQLIETLGISLAKRTLQRRLAALVEAGQLQTVGDKRARRYFIPSDVALANHVPSETILLSVSAQAIQKKVRQDIKKRMPVGYNRAFLEAYQPNVTYYLSAKERELLLEMGTPFMTQRKSGTFVKNILNYLTIDLSWNSSRLEGNTYSLLETERLLNLGKMAEDKNPLDAQMLLNHKAAIEFLVDQAEALRINSSTILNLHALLSDNLLGDPSACGRLRTIPVGIFKTVYHPLEIPQLVHEIFHKILMTAQAINDPFEQAFFLMVHLPYLQPFEDVNKRVSRLAANIPLIRDNLCPLSFIDVSEKHYIEGMLGVYELNKTELLKDIFIWAYQRSCQKYSTVQHLTGEPDLIRFKYRDVVADVVSTIIHKKMLKTQAIDYIAQSAKTQIDEIERARFIEVIDRELMGLHIGNIARFKITPDEFHEWHKQWQ